PALCPPRRLSAAPPGGAVSPPRHGPRSRRRGNTTGRGGDSPARSLRLVHPHAVVFPFAAGTRSTFRPSCPGRPRPGDTAPRSSPSAPPSPSPSSCPFTAAATDNDVSHRVVTTVHSECPESELA